MTEFPPLRYTSKDYESANANCGVAALAAFLGKTLDEALALLPDFKKNVSQEMMEKALTLAGHKWEARRCLRPSHGLAIVRVDGPWSQDEAPGHWIATSGKKVFDSRAIESGWLPVEEWGTRVFPRLAATFPGATGKCWISYGIEIEE